MFEGRETQPGIDKFQYNIWIVRSDGSNLRRLTDFVSDAGPGWSPDGSQVAFVRSLQDTDGNGIVNLNDNSDIFILSLDSNVVTRVSWNPYDNFNIDWSPNGEWIVYCSIRDDNNRDGVLNLNDSRNLYIIHPDGTGEQEIILGDLLTFGPAWSNDGRKILFGVVKGDNIEELWIYDWEEKNADPITPQGPYFYPTWGK